MGHLLSSTLRLQAFPFDDLLLLLGVLLCALVDVAVIQHPPCTQALLCLQTSSAFRPLLPDTIL